MKRAAFLSALAWAAAGAAAAQTCSCAPPSVSDLIEDPRALVVASARVRAILPGSEPAKTILRLEVLEFLKGKAPRVLDLTGATRTEAPCGVDLRPGEVRIVALVKKADGGWTTDRCLVAQP